MVSEALGVVLPSTILFDYPSIDSLCGYILATQASVAANTPATNANTVQRLRQL